MKLPFSFAGLLGRSRAPELPSLHETVGQMSAATQLPPVEDPKVKKGLQALPSFARTAKPDKDAVLPRADRRLANTNIESYRNGQTTRTVMRDFIAASPDLSAAVSAYLRTAITPDFVAVAKNLDGTFNVEATQLLQQLITRFDVLGDYKDGFCGTGSMRSTAESLGKELLTYGSMALELVLDKARLPARLQPLSVVHIEFKDNGEGGLTPQQNLAGEETDLDIATFFYTALDQDLLEPYSAPPFESSIQPVLFSTEFMNDLRRVIKRAIHPRLDVNIVWEKFKEAMPQDAMHDSDKLRAYMNQFIAEIQTMVNDLKPEDALVHFDSVEMDYVNNGNSSFNEEVKVVKDISDAKVATGARTMPSVLGHGSGTQTATSSETLLFMKSAEGMVQLKLNEIFSRVLTLAVRLFGHDVYVIFRFGKVDLRPDAELESFKQMRQERILRQLSLGFITDEEASLELTGALPPPGFKPLAGTGFMDPVKEPSGNPASNTGGASNASQGKAQTPAAAKGGQR